MAARGKLANRRGSTLLHTSIQIRCREDSLESIWEQGGVDWIVELQRSVERDRERSTQSHEKVNKGRRPPQQRQRRALEDEI